MMTERGCFDRIVSTKFQIMRPIFILAQSPVEMTKQCRALMTDGDSNDAFLANLFGHLVILGYARRMKR
jgi:hypothetical protein